MAVVVWSRHPYVDALVARSAVQLDLDDAQRWQIVGAFVAAELGATTTDTV